MALIDVVKYEMNEGELCYKFPSEDLRIGTQLVVYPAQTAFFIKGGAICDEFTSGTYTIKTNNIPILNKLINIPFGNNTPFNAEVWFVNQITKLDLPWGTPQQIQIEDPKYKIIVPIRAHGQYGIKITKPRLFIESLIGNMSYFTTDKIEQYFKGKIISYLNSIIAKSIVQGGVSILDINSEIINLSSLCENELNSIFEDKYGIKIVEFSIMSITTPQDDESVIKLKQAKDFSARINITGRDMYQMERSFDVLEKVASNEGIGGQMTAMGVGLGAGVSVGNVIGNNISGVINTNPPPLPQETLYHVYINGMQQGGYTIQMIRNSLNQGIINANTLVWRIGMPKWEKLSDIPEFSQQSILPPPLPIND